MDYGDPSEGGYSQLPSDMREAIRNQSRAAETRRRMTERYHAAVVRGRHPRSFPRTSALWVHANASKERSVRLLRGQSLASVVGGDPRVFSSLTFQGSQLDDLMDEPSYTPGMSGGGWTSSAGSGSRSLDLNAPPGTAGMGMFPPLHGGGSAPGTAGAMDRVTGGGGGGGGGGGDGGENSRHGGKPERRSRHQRDQDRSVAKFQFGRRLSIGRKVAEGAQASAVAAAARASGKARGGRKGAKRGRRHGKQRRGSVSPSEALAQVRKRTSEDGGGVGGGGVGGGSALDADIYPGVGHSHSRASGRGSTTQSSTHSSREPARNKVEKGARPMGLGANLSGVSSSTGLANEGAKAKSPYEEDTIPEFTDSKQVSVFYGSTIALQMSDGRFLSIEEDSGRVSCRHWPDVEDIGIRQQATHPNDPRSVPARCLLTLTNLRDMNSSDPIHYGDPVHLVVASGSGIPDWKNGSLIGAQIEHAPHLGTVGLSRLGSNIRNPAEVNDEIGSATALPTVVPHSVMSNKGGASSSSDGADGVGDAGGKNVKPIWLPGPVTPENETGWYSKKDPLYDKLWKDRNRVSMVVGCWVFMPPKQSAAAPIRRAKASKEARAAVDKTQKSDSSGKSEYDRVELNNLDEVYLEQDWFYLSQDPDDHSKTVLRQLPGSNRDGAEVAREAVKKRAMAKAKRSGKVGSFGGGGGGNAGAGGFFLTQGASSPSKASPSKTTTKKAKNPDKKRRDPPQPGEVVERRGMWKIRVVGVNNAAPKGKGGVSRQDAIERTLYKARKQLKRSTRIREGKNRSYGANLQGGARFTRQIRTLQQTKEMEVDDRYLSHEEDKMHQLAGYFENRYRQTTESIPLFEAPDPRSRAVQSMLLDIRRNRRRSGGSGGMSRGSRGGYGSSRGSSSMWSLDGGGSALLPSAEAALGLGGHYLRHSLSLGALADATKLNVDLFPEDRLISGRLRKEDEKKEREFRAYRRHHEQYGVFAASIEMPNAVELRAPIPLEPLLGEWAHGVPQGDAEKKRLKKVFTDEDNVMQSAIRYEQRADHSTLTEELRGDSLASKSSLLG
jgi:hypothetical protein